MQDIALIFVGGLVLLSVGIMIGSFEKSEDKK